MTINKLDTNGWWMVGTSPIYTPSVNTKVEHTNVAGSETGRTEDGLMHIYWVRRDVRKVYLQYPVMTKAELDYMMDLLQGKEFQFTFPDRGEVVTMSAYCGESKYSLYSSALYNEDLYTDVSINVIEM